MNALYPRAHASLRGFAARIAAKALIGAVAAVSIYMSTPDARAAGPVALAVDQATVLRLARPAGTIILGNPLIADASVQDSSTLVLTGRSFGVTNIIVLDGAGEEVLNTQLSVNSGSSSSHVVTMHKRTLRTSFSCTPECEQAPMVGDDPELFERIAGQITARNDLSVAE